MFVTYYFSQNNYIVYPNPAAQYSEINIAAKTVDISIMEVYNSIGIKVYDKMDMQLPKLGLLQLKDAETKKIKWHSIQISTTAGLSD